MFWKANNLTSDTSNWYFIIHNCKVVCVNDNHVALVRITAAGLLYEHYYEHYYNCLYHIPIVLHECKFCGIADLAHPWICTLQF